MHTVENPDQPFVRSAEHEQDWKPYPVDPYSAIYDDHTCIHTGIVTIARFAQCSPKPTGQILKDEGHITVRLSTCRLHANRGCGKERRMLIGPW